MKTNRIITLILLFLSWGFSSASAQEGAAALDKAVDKFNVSNDVSATFTLTMHNAMGDPITQQTGTIKLSGNRFYWNTDEMEVWYDGKTQWTYVKAIEEVNLSEPTAEEISAINPYSLVAHYKKLFDVKPLPSEKNQEAVVELTPKKSGSNLDRIVVTLNRTTWTPSCFKLYTSDRSHTKIVISKYTPGQKFPSKTFIFDKGQYPQAELIDLR